MGKMYINDIENKDELFSVIVNELRDHGIKYRKEKKSKNGQVSQMSVVAVIIYAKQ